MMQELIPHLFRTEYRKLVSVLCHRFGSHQIDLAEDICSDTFLTAAQSWPLNGIPKNPVAWLYNVARNKAINELKRNAVFQNRIVRDLTLPEELTEENEIDLSPQNINDSQLRMMFVICRPNLSPEAQTGLCLRILCGFGIQEIADAFLTNKETINKRLLRAKEKLREEKVGVEFPTDSEIGNRVAAVLKTIYLLFNEGYFSVSNRTILRKELCYEAMRLCQMLIENASTNKPEVNALLALMCFHASRFDARIDQEGALILYDDQDPCLWNTDLISKGAYFLKNSAKGNELSKYHLEAGIAYWNTVKSDSNEKWENVLLLYNQLLQLEYSPAAALNRTYALAKARGKQSALVEAEKLQLADNHFYYALLGELFSGIDNTKACENFQRALALAKTNAEKQVLQRKLEAISGRAID